jgi:beta-glucanase (GH16 family)
VALLLVVPVMAAAQGVVTARHGGASRSPPQLLLREDFDGSQLNRSRWRTCHWWAARGCTIASNHELQWYQPEQVRVHGGALRLVAQRRRVRGSGDSIHRYVSGMVSSGPARGSSRAKFAFRYGRAEIRARVPAGKGLWSAFWLLPVSRTSKPEIDVMEIVGQRPDLVEFHLHWRARNGTVKQRGKRWANAGLRSGWHTFAIDWRPGSLTWRVDGVVRWRVRGTVVPSTPMYLIVNLAVGGDWPGAPDSSTTFPGALLVDSVKVWR